MDSHSVSSVIIVGAGVSGISAAKALIENGIEDVVILEASDRIGGRIRKENFGDVSVELGAGWIAGVGGKESNPVWELAKQSALRTCFSDYSNARYNIYDRRGECEFTQSSAEKFGAAKPATAVISIMSCGGAFYASQCFVSQLMNTALSPLVLISLFYVKMASCSGKIFPSGIAAESYKKAVDSAIEKLRNQEADRGGEASKVIEPPSMAKTPIELAIDFILHDFEMAEVEPISTYTDFGEREFLVADERGYEYLLYKMAEDFLFTSEGRISDSRLKLNKVVRELQHSRTGVTVITEDGCFYEANYVILSVSIGVLQSDLVAFNPPLPRWKLEAIEKCDVMVYTKIFLKFPCKFWPSGPEKEFFIYAHERRGYYTFWQHMENAYPGSNILVVTLTNGESKRVEAQSDEETLKEAMVVLRDMFGPNIPDATDILVPRWWNNRFQRGSYSNYPIISNFKHVHDIKAPVGRIFFTGEHTSERFNGYVHGGYLAGIETGKSLLEEMSKERKVEGQSLLLEPLLALTGSLSLSQPETVSNLHKCDIPKQLYLSGKLGIPEAIL